ncbi:MAG TPA: ABC transporter permease [Gemmatimonadaceae bacterium]|nr:ABC transporter permease [Gemmatimonadaceae bacterium]
MRDPNPLWHRYLRFWRSDPRADLDDELAFHVQARIDEYIATGMNPEQARAEAEHRLGDLARVRVECSKIDQDFARRRSMSDIMRGVITDLRVALRQLRRERAITAAAGLCLVLGIGANTAIFSVVDAVLFRPLPFRDANRLVLVGEGLPKIGDQNFGTISTPDYLDFKTLDGPVFAASAVFKGEAAALTGGDAPERVTGLSTSASLFRVLGVRPALGRDFAPDADALGSPDVVIISDALWHRRFGGDPGIIGRAITLDGKPTTVIGVMPPSFSFPLPGLEVDPAADFFVPLRMTPAVMHERGNSYDAFYIARLAPGVPLRRARAAANEIASRMAELHPDAFPRGFPVVANAVPLRQRLVADVRRSLLILLGAVGFVLLIACINVSGLLLARAAARSREIAVRTALGASRGRLVQQFLAESAVLVTLGAAGGLLLAHWGTRALAALAPDGLLDGYRIGIDVRVLAVTLAVVLLATIAFSLAPVLQRREDALPERLREEGRGTSTGRARQRGRRVLVVSEIALALVLAAGAGLLLRSFAKAMSQDPGFDPAHLLTFQVTLPSHGYPTAPQVARAEQQLVEQLAAIPGVTRATAGFTLPMAGQWKIAATPEGVPLPKTPLLVNDLVMPGYFKAMGIPLVAGRTFDAHDVVGAPPVAIVDEEFAKRYYPGETVIGRRLKWGTAGSRNPWMTIIGVVRTVKAHSMDEQSTPETYFPVLQFANDSTVANYATRSMRYVVRTAGDPLAVAGAVRHVVHSMNPALPLTHMETAETLIAQSMASRRFDMLLLTSFAALALVLAAAGIYGLIAYSVTQRQREIGVRMAIGATSGGIVRLVLREGAWTTAVGAVLGLVGAAALTRVMQSLLFGVGAVDVVTFACATGLLVAVALLASWLPARRAARVDPVVTIRGD